MKTEVFNLIEPGELHCTLSWPRHVELTLCLQAAVLSIRKCSLLDRLTLHTYNCKPKGCAQTFMYRGIFLWLVYILKFLLSKSMKYVCTTDCNSLFSFITANDDYLATALTDTSSKIPFNVFDGGNLQKA